MRATRGRLPKSSKASPTPFARNARSATILVSSLLSAMFSVISISSSSGGSRLAFSAASTCAEMISSWNCAGKRFTAIRTGGRPMARQASPVSQAFWRIQLPTSSAVGLCASASIKAAGVSSPFCGCCHRSSASAPTTRAIAQLDLRLEMQDEFVLRKSAPDVAFHFVPRLSLRAHGAGEQAILASARGPSRRKARDPNLRSAPRRYLRPPERTRCPRWRRYRSCGRRSRSAVPATSGSGR